jgi:hypothetical protein
VRKTTETMPTEHQSSMGIHAMLALATKEQADQPL